MFKIEEKNGGRTLVVSNTRYETLEANHDRAMGDWSCVKRTKSGALMAEVETKEDALLWLMEKGGLIKNASYSRSGNLIT